MSAPLSTSGAPSEVQAWQELEDVFARLGHLARTPVAPHEFYRTVLDQSVRALSADGGGVWLRAANGSMQLALQTGRASDGPARNEAAQLAHQALLAQVAAGGIVVAVGPQSASENSVPLNFTDHVLVLGPVRTLTDGSHSDKRVTNRADQAFDQSQHTSMPQESATLAIVEL